MLALKRFLPISLIALLALAGCSNGTTEIPTLRTTSPCPPWVNYPADTHSNAGSPYLGCANAANLRAMVENPQDLDHGRTLAPADGARESGAVETYRRRQVKDFTDENGPRPIFAAPGATTGGNQ